MKSIFEYEEYRDFLTDHLSSQGKGAKLRLAEILTCQPGYISQILAGTANMSPEQAEKFTSEMGWSSPMTQYFLLLVAHARAGTTGLKKHLAGELSRHRGEAQVLKNRFKPEKVLSVEDQATFYSSWHYGAVHVSVSIPGCESETGLAKYLDLPLKRVNEITQFLLRVGLIKQDAGDRLVIGNTQIYIGADSPLISKHHTNWRLRAIEAQDRYKENHLHYSSVVSISEKDIHRVRELMATAIEKIRAIIRESKDEKCFSYAMDLFEVGK